MTRVLAFVVGCAALFAAALGVGRVVGPLDVEPAAAEHGHASGSEDTMQHAGHDVGGLEATQDGYTLHLEGVTDGVLSFHVLAPDGDPVTAYDEQHERDLHLVVVRRDLTGFQHVHPALDATGRWSVPVSVTPGAWRVVADTQPTGAEPLVLGADLLVPGDFAPEPLGEDRLDAQVDGYDVTLGGSYVAGQESVLTATVLRDGVPVTDLQPYLGARGHLVSLRDGDVGYLHVHPDAGTSFTTTFPTAGRYRLFLDFKHGDAVHTAAFTVTVSEAGEAGHDDDHDD
jgi:hypothetical protein